MNRVNCPFCDALLAVEHVGFVLHQPKSSTKPDILTTRGIFELDRDFRVESKQLQNHLMQEHSAISN